MLITINGNKKWGYHKAKIKGVFNRSYCCCGNLFCHKIDSNLFSNGDFSVLLTVSSHLKEVYLARNLSFDANV